MRAIRVTAMPRPSRKAYQYRLARRFKAPVQRPARLIDKPADSHEIIYFGFMSVISGTCVGYYSG